MVWVFITASYFYWLWVVEHNYRKFFGVIKPLPSFPVSKDFEK